MARTSSRRWKGCAMCKPWKFAGHGDSLRIPPQELRRMGGKRRRVSRKDVTAED